MPRQLKVLMPERRIQFAVKEHSIDTGALAVGDNLHGLADEKLCARSTCV